MATKTFFIIGFLMHSLACLFTYIGLVHVLFKQEHYDSWINRFDLAEASPIEIYSTSLIFTAVTITTTGYGDIYALTNLEKIFACFLIYIGIVTFSMIRQRIKMWRSQAKVSRVIYWIEEDATDFFISLSQVEPTETVDSGNGRKPCVMDSLQLVINYKVQQFEQSTIEAFH